MMRDDEKVYSDTQLYFYISLLIIVNLIAVSIWLFTATADDKFFSHFSFASTVASIILSILAIFMSVMGEAKTQSIRERIERETKEITNLTNRLEEKLAEVLERINSIDDNTSDIRAALIKHPNDVQITSAQNNVLTSNDINRN